MSMPSWSFGVVEADRFGQDDPEFLRQAVARTSFPPWLPFGPAGYALRVERA